MLSDVCCLFVPTQPLLCFNLTATLPRFTAADTVGLPFKRMSQHAGVQRECAGPQHGATGIDAGLAGPRPSMCHLDLQNSSVIQISPPLSSLPAEEVRLISEGCRHSLSTTYPVTLNRWKILWPKGVGGFSSLASFGIFSAKQASDLAAAADRWQDLFCSPAPGRRC